MEHSTPGRQGDISFLDVTQDQGCNRLFQAIYVFTSTNKKGMLWMEHCFRFTVIILCAHALKMLLPFKVLIRSSQLH